MHGRTCSGWRRLPLAGRALLLIANGYIKWNGTSFAERADAWKGRSKRRASVDSTCMHAPCRAAPCCTPLFDAARLRQLHLMHKILKLHPRCSNLHARTHACMHARARRAPSPPQPRSCVQRWVGAALPGLVGAARRSPLAACSTHTHTHRHASSPAYAVPLTSASGHDLAPSPQLCDVPSLSDGTDGGHT